MNLLERQGKKESLLQVNTTKLSLITKKNITPGSKLDCIVLGPEVENYNLPYFDKRFSHVDQISSISATSKPLIKPADFIASSSSGKGKKSIIKSDLDVSLGISTESSSGSSSDKNNRKYSLEFQSQQINYKIWP